MITETATEAPTGNARHQQGADLLEELLAQLQHLGYTKRAVDTYRNDADGHNVRHAYSGGEWTLTHWTDGGGYVQVRWGVRATMPNVGTLLSAVLPVPF